MSSDKFEELKDQLAKEGPTATINNLCQHLQEIRDYSNLFYALLMKKRHEMGVSPVPTAPAQKLPVETHSAYEQGIQEAARTVGNLYLKEGNIPGAFPYFNMLGELQPIRDALEHYEPAPEEDIEPLVNIAFHQGVHPQKGFDWILNRYGLCSAITTIGGHEFPFGQEVHEYCLKRVVRELYEELRERLAAEINRVEGKAPPANASVAELMEGRFYLFAEDLTFVDVSHLNAVVQHSLRLSPGKELNLARELCRYGEKLSTQFRYQSEPPFEDQYKDYGIYLSVLAGEKTEEGIAHFRAKVEGSDPRELETYPAEILVNLLLRAGKDQEALEIASRYLVEVDERQLTCPGVVELCERTGDYSKLADLAKKHQNLVHYLAGLLASKT